MQEYWVGVGEQAKLIKLPAPDVELLPGLSWGRGDVIDTPAYWALRCQNGENPLHGFCKPNGDLIEEIGFCMLGGFGITVELNVAAYERLDAAGVFDLRNAITELEIRSLLIEPLFVSGRWRKYRFPNQRSARLHAMRQRMAQLDYKTLSETDAASILGQLSGIGPKTAAWILRNHFGSDQVAILDVHVVRACKRLGIFPDDVKLPRDYQPLQERFLELADRLAIRPSVLDAIMWIDMRAGRQG